MKLEFSPKPEKEKTDKKPRDISRRKFLKVAGGAMVGAALGSAFSKSGETHQREKEEVWRITPETLGKDLKVWSEIKDFLELEKEEIEKIIEYLWRRYGLKNEVALLGRASLDLDLFYDVAAAEKRGQDWSVGIHRSQLAFAANDYRLYWDGQAIEEWRRVREAEEGLDARFEGFEQIPGLTSEEIKIQTEKKFNRRWLYGNIGLFRYEDREEKKAHYMVAGSVGGVGFGALHVKDEAQDVIIYRHPGMRFDELHRLIGHEIGHHQDWVNSNRLSIPEKLRFLREVADRFASPDRWRSVYIDYDVPQEYADKKAEWGEVRHHQVVLHRQLREFWATIIELYTNTPEVLKSSKPKDYALAEKWYRRLIED